MSAPLNVRLAVLAVALISALTVSSVFAHGKPVRCEPLDGQVLDAVPRELRLCFNEAIDGEFSTFTATDQQGRRIEVSDVHVDPADDSVLTGILPELEPGVYTVEWRALSRLDGHLTRGNAVFRVGGAGEPASEVSAGEEWLPVQPAEAVLRWAGFVFLSLAIGALATVHLLLGTKEASADEEKSLRAAHRRALRWAALGSCGAMAAGLGLLFAQSAALADGSLGEAVGNGVWWHLLSQTRYGALWVGRQGALLALTLGAVFVKRPTGGTGAAAAALAAGLAVVQALNSHSASLNDDRAAAVVVDAFHLLAASVWIGGLLALLVTVPPIRPNTREKALARRAWRRFGVLAGAGIAVLVVTGLYSTGRQVASPDALLTTLYGQALITKMLLIVPTVGIGLANALLLRAGARPITRVESRKRPHLQLLSLLIPAEVALGLAIFLAVAVITSAAPPRGTEFERRAQTGLPSFLSQPVDDLIFTLSVRPNKPGDNIIDVAVFSTRRPPLADVEGVTVRFRHRQGVASVAAAPEGPDRYRLVGPYFGRSGPWLVEVVAHRTGLEESVAPFHWTVASATPQAGRPVLLSDLPLRSPLTIAAVAVATALIVPAATIWMWNRLRRPPRWFPNLSLLQPATAGAWWSAQEPGPPGKVTSELPCSPATGRTISPGVMTVEPRRRSPAAPSARGPG